MIIIKKYPNRRLYDTSQSQYINLEDIKLMVLEHKEFQVIDSKSQEELTKHILLQIINEQEANDQESLLTNSVLKQLIRFYGSEMQVVLRPYLEQSMATFLERQDSMQGMMKGIVGATPVGLFGQMIEKNMEIWRKVATGQAADEDPKKE